MHDIVKEACFYALEAHGAQRYGDQPYFDHLEAVVDVLEEFDVTDETILAAGYLHDVLEDTEVTLADLLVRFGPEVAMLVFAVTDEPGANRAERKARTYPKIEAVGKDAVTLKYADRIANVRACVAAGDTNRLDMYRKEWPVMRARFLSLADSDMNAELEELLGKKV